MKNDTVSNKSALHAFQLLKDDAAITDDVIDSLGAFQVYLCNLCDRICKSGLKDRFVHQWIFTTKTELKQKDCKSYAKANLFAAAVSLKRILSKLRQDTDMNEMRKRMLTDFICDLRPFVACFDEDQDYSWLLINTNSHTTNFYYDLSVNVFWNGMPGDHPEEQLVLSTSTPFIIRQSIEYKIKRILGIDYILIDDNPDKRSMKKFFGAIRNNKEFYQIRNFNFDTIEGIHSWTNLYVHGGYRPESWQTETALNYLKPLFYSGETSQKRSYSRYAGVEVKESDLVDLKRNTDRRIKKGVKGEVYIKWLRTPEVAVLS